MKLLLIAATLSTIALTGCKNMTLERITAAIKPDSKPIAQEPQPAEIQKKFIPDKQMAPGGRLSKKIQQQLIAAKADSLKAGGTVQVICPASATASIMAEIAATGVSYQQDFTIKNGYVIALSKTAVPDGPSSSATKHVPKPKRTASVSREEHDSGIDSFNIVISDPLSEDPYIVFSSIREVMLPVIAPNDNYLAYVSYETGNASLFVQHIASGHRQLIKKNLTEVSSLRWSYDNANLLLKCCGYSFEQKIPFNP